MEFHICYVHKSDLSIALIRNHKHCPVALAFGPSAMAYGQGFLNLNYFALIIWMFESGDQFGWFRHLTEFYIKLYEPDLQVKVDLNMHCKSKKNKAILRLSKVLIIGKKLPSVPFSNCIFTHGSPNLFCCSAISK